MQRLRFFNKLFRSASIMESLSTNTLTIELWNLSNDNIGSHIKIMKFLFMLTIKTNFRVY